MIFSMFKRRVVADKSAAHFCQILCSVIAGLVLVLGIRRLAVLDLNEAELSSALNGTLILTAVFIILGFQCRAWRRSA